MAPDTRTHRGPHQEDARLFSDETLPALQAATSDLSWLLSKDYSMASSLKLVGDRYALEKRQRIAVRRSSCSDQMSEGRTERRVCKDNLSESSFAIDGFNIITTIEAALGGGVIIKGRDSVYRDMASVLGTYRNVEETLPALSLIGKALARLNAAQCFWFLDRPVSNSGRLREFILEAAEDRGWDWEVELVQNPDQVLAETSHIVITGDGGILNLCGRWFHLAGVVIDRGIPDAQVLDLGEEG